MTIEAGIAIRSLRLGVDHPGDWIATLDRDEQARAGRFRLPADRDRFVLGRGLLRDMIGAATSTPPAALRFVYDGNGKPAVEGLGEVAFNLSHSGDLVMAALGRARSIGLDVELHRADLDVAALGPHVFTGRELAPIMAAAPKARTALFFRQWVFKEALLKGLGTGLSKDPREVEVLFSNGAPSIRFTTPAFDDKALDGVARGWQLRQLPVESGYSAALAVLPLS